MRERIAALDIGTKRIGVAISDPLAMTAQPLCVIERRGIAEDVRQIQTALDRYAVRCVVVGLPLELSGREGAQAKSVRRFCAEFEARTGWPVVLQDERLSTAEGERMLVAAGVRRSKRRRVIDKTAAALILQAFLDAGGGLA